MARRVGAGGRPGVQHDQDEHDDLAESEQDAEPEPGRTGGDVGCLAPRACAGHRSCIGTRTDVA